MKTIIEVMSVLHFPETVELSALKDEQKPFTRAIKRGKLDLVLTPRN